MHEFARTELRRLLVGHCFTTVEIGDAWALAFDHFWLVAQEIFPPDEDDLARIVAQAWAGAPPIVDGADLPRALGVLRCRRQPVSEVIVLDDGSLSLTFEGGGVLNIPTDVEVVDWYWGLSNENVGPYTSFLVACFERGRIEVADPSH